MPHHDIDTVLGWRGHEVLDADGEKIGPFGDVFLDRETQRPAWGGVRTGLFGLRESYVPLERVEVVGDELRVPFTKEVVKDAPKVDPEVALTASEEEALWRHYGQEYVHLGGDDAGAQPTEGAVSHGAAAEGTHREGAHREGAHREGTHREGAHRDDTYGEGVQREGAHREGEGRLGDDAMTRSEEEVRVHEGPMRPAERVRLRKVMVTENQTKTVPVRKEVVQLETDAPPEGRVDEVVDVDDDPAARR